MSASAASYVGVDHTGEPVVPAGVGGTEDAYYLWSDGPGGVTSYRTGISATGEWLFFLPDD